MKMIRNLFSKTKKYDKIKQIRSDASAQEINEKLKLRISEDAYLRIKEFVRICPCEIGGTVFGTVDVDEGDIFINRVELPPQKVSGASVEYEHILPDREQLIEITNSVVDEHGVAQGNKLLGTWHSHAQMDTWASVVDEECAKKFLATPPVIPNTLFITLIFNKLGKEFARVDYVVDRETITYVDNIKLIVEDGGRMDAIRRECKELYDNNVVEEKVVKQYGVGYHDYDADYDYAVNDYPSQYPSQYNDSFLDEELIDLDLDDVKPNKKGLSLLVSMEIELESQLERLKGGKFKKRRRQIRKRLDELDDKIIEVRNMVNMFG
jgi:proteasome lid subunit RPN8/RPN11